MCLVFAGYFWVLCTSVALGWCSTILWVWLCDLMWVKLTLVVVCMNCLDFVDFGWLYSCGYFRVSCFLLLVEWFGFRFLII